MSAPRQRANGAGTVFLVPSRSRPWAAAVTIGWTPSGKPARRTRFASTKAEAERLLDQMAAGKIPPRLTQRRIVPESTVEPRHRRRAERAAISSRMRFLVLQRDGFACVYCGRHAAPDVELVVDHVIAYANSGADTIENYATACFDCNAGKSDL